MTGRDDGIGYHADPSVDGFDTRAEFHACLVQLDYVTRKRWALPRDVPVPDEMVRARADWTQLLYVLAETLRIEDEWHELLPEDYDGITDPGIMQTP